MRRLRTILLFCVLLGSGAFYWIFHESDVNTWPRMDGEPITYINGDIYIGEVFNKWVPILNQVKHGQGTFVWVDGVMYVGEFRYGKLHGQGTLTFHDSKSVGEFKYGKRNGQHVATSEDGHRYVGEVKDDKKHGQGTASYPDGSKYVGEYKEGKRWTGNKYDADGKVTDTYLNGVRQLE